MREIVCYSIEARHPVTGFWKVKQEIMCEYRRESVKLRFLWFTWFKSRITNKHEAELHCRKKAMICCLSYEKEHKDVRITLTWLDMGDLRRSHIWENGVWKDC